MRHPLTKTKKGWRGVRMICASIFLATLWSINFGFGVPRTHAVLGAGDTVIEVGPNFIATNIKEFPLDVIGFTLAKLALQQIQKETLRWINSGFDGSPAFVQDLDGFLAKRADRIAGEFIYGSALNALCRPFQLDVRIALQIQRGERERPARCTLSGVVGNVERFLGGDFASGGLPGWFEMTVNPNNNFFGASASAQSALFGRLEAGERNNLNRLTWGSGFLDTQECMKVLDDDGQGNEFEREVCETVTPGQTISNALSFELSTGQQTLIEADEINEIISALFQQLALKAFTGAKGLLGLTQKGSDGKPAYLDQIGNPKYDSVPGQNNIGNEFIANAIKDEQRFRDLYADLVLRADRILARIEELERLVADNTDDEEWVCSSMEDIRAQAKSIRAAAFVIQDASDKTLAKLNALQARFVTATQNMYYSTAAVEDRLIVVDEFLKLRESGILHTSFTFPQDEEAVKPTQAQLQSLAVSLESRCTMTPVGSGDDDDDSDE